MFVVIRIVNGGLGVARPRNVSLPWRSFLGLTGVVTMTHFAFAARGHIRNVVLCSLATLTLAACGSDGSSGAAATSAAATGSSSVATLVSPNAGVITRSSGVTTVASGTQTATTNPVTKPSSGAGSPTTTTPGSGTTVASTGNGSTPVKTTTTGVATLDWLPPTENSDGSTLTNLAGYTVYYGTSPDNLAQSVKVSNPGLTAYAVTGLSSGTWYFAVTSYSSTGVESTRTGTVSTTI